MSALLMGFDFGTRKIGIAVGQTVTKTASALTIIRARDGKPDWNQLDALVKEWQPTLFVVGLPLNMDDSISEMAEAAERFARRLEGRYQTPYAMMDERLTSFEARESSTEEEIDAIAAQLILESFMNQAS
jgi:putative Holliday junction resolvase